MLWQDRVAHGGLNYQKQAMVQEGKHTLESNHVFSVEFYFTIL